MKAKNITEIISILIKHEKAGNNNNNNNNNK